jgi:hypothetical protein
VLEQGSVEDLVHLLEEVGVAGFQVLLVLQEVLGDGAAQLLLAAHVGVEQEELLGVLGVVPVALLEEALLALELLLGLEPVLAQELYDLLLGVLLVQPPDPLQQRPPRLGLQLDVRQVHQVLLLRGHVLVVQLLSPLLVYLPLLAAVHLPLLGLLHTHLKLLLLALRKKV